MGYEVTISNSSLNRYGFRVLTSGIDIEQYKKNPIMLYMHVRSWRDSKETILPLGTVENVRIDGDQVLGTLKFDEADDFSKSIKAKWDAGTLRMVSPGLTPIEKSEDPEYLLPGQRYSTVTKSRLDEISVVDIAGNDDALALYLDGKRITLSDSANSNLEYLQSIENLNSENNMKSIALKLGLAENASEAEIVAKIEAIQLVAGKVTEMEKTVKDQTDAAIIQLVDGAIREKRITADKKEHFVGLGKTVGVEQLQKTIELMAPVTKPTEMIIPGAGGSSAKKWGEMDAAERISLRDGNREEYIKLYKAEYGIEPKI